MKRNLDMKRFNAKLLLWPHQKVANEESALLKDLIDLQKCGHEFAPFRKKSFKISFSPYFRINRVNDRLRLPT